MTGIFDTKKKCDERILGRGLPLSCGIDFTCIRCEERQRLASEVFRVIENEIDHYTPYRPLTDSSEMKEVRKVLGAIIEKLGLSESDGGEE